MSLLHLALWAESARVLPPANPCPISLCAYCSRSGRMVQHTQISYRRAPAATGLPFVIPAAVGIHAPSFRERTSIAIPSPTAQRNTRNRPHGRSSRPNIPHTPIRRRNPGEARVDPVAPGLVPSHGQAGHPTGQPRRPSRHSRAAMSRTPTQGRNPPAGANRLQIPVRGSAL